MTQFGQKEPWTSADNFERRSVQVSATCKPFATFRHRRAHQSFSPLHTRQFQRLWKRSQIPNLMCEGHVEHESLVFEIPMTPVDPHIFFLFLLYLLNGRSTISITFVWPCLSFPLSHAPVSPLRLHLLSIKFSRLVKVNFFFEFLLLKGLSPSKYLWKIRSCSSCHPLFD